MRIPLVALVCIWPVVLVVTLGAAALSPETLAGVPLEDDQLTQGTGTPAPHLVAIALDGLPPQKVPGLLEISPARSVKFEFGGNIHL